jgi:hypothetical protein
MRRLKWRSCVFWKGKNTLAQRRNEGLYRYHFSFSAEQHSASAMVSLSAIALMTDDDALTEAVMAEADELDEGALVLKDPQDLLRRFKALWKLSQVRLKNVWRERCMSNSLIRDLGRHVGGRSRAVAVGALRSVFIKEPCLAGGVDGILRPN